ncbi:hypothetical protein HIM_08798 [Hirsutella minnesotensis 3608]|uniref:Uncharacterized protein n=1 Tax=Hirsutella minnesotensis 3608 TaxID=1043627 RepID=A0A0F7ZSQ6_9HYPO|nr:hypothetical protein HIM_08798 [Hirsutella minnesotensis 3608]
MQEQAEKMVEYMLEEEERFDEAFMTSMAQFFDSQRSPKHFPAESLGLLQSDRAFLDKMRKSRPCPSALPQETRNMIRDILGELVIPAPCTQTLDFLRSLPKQASPNNVERLETLRQLLEWDPTVTTRHLEGRGSQCVHPL